MLINSRFRRHVKRALDCGEHRRFDGRVRLLLPGSNHPGNLESGRLNIGGGLSFRESLPCPKAVKRASPQSKATPGRVGIIANIGRLLRAIRLPLTAAHVCFSPLARGTAGQAAPVAAAVNVPLFKANTRILFQGDSITDGERNRNDCPPSSGLRMGCIPPIPVTNSWRMSGSGRSPNSSSENQKR